ncbi:FAD-binding oxidoreductase [Micromonospora matsumotoense]|uniref:NAD(P)/FAD-dependent oxidoreductase n=1 Tax=Micromonospora matsumotoense TaxID=121616 RepID=UPI00344479AA
MVRSADAVVVGGGVIGVSALYHLAARGVRDVVLLERDTLGGGSTAAAAGGFRAQFSDELNIRLALRCIDAYQRFQAEFDIDIGFRQTGYLFLLRAEEEPHFRTALRLQQSMGVPAELVPVDEALRHVPGTSPDGLSAATFCPIDGLATPHAVVQGYAAAARRLGAHIVQHDAVREILVRDGRVAGVRSAQGEIATPLVVLASGVWSPELARTAGVDLPVTAERRFVHYVASDAGLPARTPLTIDFATGLYFHREGAGLIVGGPWATPEELAPVALQRLPFLADLGVANTWSGLYEMSPDHNALVGRCDEPAGLLYATGFSGHGFQQAPGIGEYLADLALDREPALDLSALSIRRFTDDLSRPELHVV